MTNERSHAMFCLLKAVAERGAGGVKQSSSGRGQEGVVRSGWEKKSWQVQYIENALGADREELKRKQQQNEERRWCFVSEVEMLIN